MGNVHPHWSIANSWHWKIAQMWRIFFGKLETDYIAYTEEMIAANCQAQFQQAMSTEIELS